MQKRVFLIHGWDGKPNNHWFPWLALELKARGWEVNAPQLPHAAEPKVAEWLDFLSDYVGKPDADTYFVGHSLGCIAIARYLAILDSGSPFVKGSTASSQEGILPFVKGVPPSPACAEAAAGGSAGRDFSKSSVSPEQILRSKTCAGEKTRPPSFRKGGIKVGGCIFVAGFSGRINVPEIREFYLPLHKTREKIVIEDAEVQRQKSDKMEKETNGKVLCGGELLFDPEKARAHCDKFMMIFSDNDSYVPMEKSLEMARQLGAKTILERGRGHFTADDGVTALPSALSALLKMST